MPRLVRSYLPSALTPGLATFCLRDAAPLALSWRFCAAVKPFVQTWPNGQKAVRLLPHLRQRTVAVILSVRRRRFRE